MTKIAAVTGTTSGIGLALVRLLLSEGIDVVQINRNASSAERLVEQFKQAFPNRRVFSVTGDLSNFSELKGVAENIAAVAPTLDYLFHNAGVLTDSMNMNEQGVELQFAVNCVTPYWLTQFLLPNLSSARQPKVVVSGSGASSLARKILVDQLVTPPNFKPMVGSYAQSKATIKVLMKLLQKEHPAIGFSVVDITPTKTKMANSNAMPLFLRWFSFWFSTTEKVAIKLFKATHVDHPIKTFSSQQSVEPSLKQLVDSLL